MTSYDMRSWCHNIVWSHPQSLLTHHIILKGSASFHIPKTLSHLSCCSLLSPNSLKILLALVTWLQCCFNTRSKSSHLLCGHDSLLQCILIDLGCYCKPTPVAYQCYHHPRASGPWLRRGSLSGVCIEAIWGTDLRLKPQWPVPLHVQTKQCHRQIHILISRLCKHPTHTIAKRGTNNPNTSSIHGEMENITTQPDCP